jgi:hypothetical protein
MAALREPNIRTYGKRSYLHQHALRCGKSRAWARRPQRESMRAPTLGAVMADDHGALISSQCETTARGSPASGSMPHKTPELRRSRAREIRACDATAVRFMDVSRLRRALKS